MLKNNAFLDDVAKLAGGAAGSVLELKKELESFVQSKISEFAASANLVSRDEFEVVREMAEKARLENIELRDKIAQLEEKCTK